MLRKESDAVKLEVATYLLALVTQKDDEGLAYIENDLTEEERKAGLMALAGSDSIQRNDACIAGQDGDDVANHGYCHTKK